MLSNFLMITDFLRFTKLLYALNRIYITIVLLTQLLFIYPTYIFLLCSADQPILLSFTTMIATNGVMSMIRVLAHETYMM
jgi:hypothetical protein